MKRVLLDMDGIVADFVSGAFNLWGERLNINLWAQAKGDDSWDMLKFFDGSVNEFWAPMNYSFWRNLPKHDDADEIVEIAERYVGRDKLCFLTSPCRTIGCMDGKVDWAAEHYPGIPVLLSRSVRGGDPPKKFVASPDSILIDDHSKNIDQWTEFGGAGFLYPRAWNREYHAQEFRTVSLNSFLATHCADEETCLRS